MNHINLKNLPESERPYERFLTLGAEALSDAELLAIILKSGTRDLTSLDLARTLLSQCQGNLLNLYEMSYEDLLRQRGIGRVKALQLKAVAELSRRIARTDRGYHIQMNNPESIAAYFMEDMRHNRQEVFKVAFFDAKCKFLGAKQISSGGLSFAYVPLTELFRETLLHQAVMIVILHNHPSGDPYPSAEDAALTQKIAQGAELLGISLADHIVIGDNRYYSFRENNRLET